MACHLVIDKHGKVTSWRFARALVRLRANIAYEHAQAAYDADAPRAEWDADVLPTPRHFCACWAMLAKARAAPGTPVADLPGPLVLPDAPRGIAEIRVLARGDVLRCV